MRSPSKTPKSPFLSCSPPDWCHRSYQSVAIYRVPHPTSALGVSKVSLSIMFRGYLWCSPPDWRPRSYQSLAIYRVPRPTGDLGVTKASQFVFLTRLAASVAKLSLCMVFPTRLAPSDLSKRRHLSLGVSSQGRYVSCSLPDWRPRS